MPFYSIPLAILALFAATLALLIFTPVVVWIDSRRREVKVRWSFLLSFVRPFPARVTGRELSRPRPKRKTPPQRKNSPTPSEAENRRRKAGRFIWNCLLDGDVRSRLVRRFRRLPIDLWDAVEVSRFDCELSLPDPAANGMLWGALATVHSASGAWLRPNFMANFIERNEVRTEVRIYPHRVVKAVAFFFLQLPYRGLLQQWRAS